MPAEQPGPARPCCGVAGSPISSSLSPVLHRAAYEALGLDWGYDAHDVDVAGLPAFLAGLRRPPWRGLSLTMPLKQAVVADCASLSDQARQVRAVNTLVVDPDGRLEGSNTDVPGLVAAWQEAGVGTVEHAAVLGGGATARSAVAALAQVGATRVSVLTRAPQRAGGVASLAQELELSADVSPLSAARALATVDLLVSTVPLPAQPALLSDEGLAELVGRAAAVFDVGYGPDESPLLRLAREAGVPCADGFAMLLHQATLQVELMTGLRPAPLEAMRSAGLAALSAPG